MKHGGQRKGAGRKFGSGKGRNAKTASISMIPELWEKVERLRGNKSRSSWIAEKIREANK